MLNVFNVAYYILDKCGEMSTFKLHKLLYYCQAWYMAWNDGNPLFQEDFEAWVNGPVVREVFNVPKKMYNIDKNFMEDKKNDKQNIDDETKKQIDTVLFYYGNKRPLQLVAMSHLESPWKETRKNISVFDLSDNIIDKKKIYEYYKNKEIVKWSRNNE